MAFKDWGFFPVAARLFAAAGYGVVTFNFSLGGVAPGGHRITEFDKFEKNTFSRELDDVRTVITGVAEGVIPIPSTEKREIILLGHSRGGGIAIVETSRDEKVGGLITWSSIATFDRWTNHQKEKWRRTGYLPLARDEMVSPLRVGISLLSDLELHHDELDIPRAASLVRVPWLILHGKVDVTVPSAEAERLFAASGAEKSQLVLLDHVGHLYNAASPEGDQYATLHSIVAITVNWLRRHSIQEN